MIESVKKLVGLGLLASALILEPAEAATPPPPASTGKPVTPATEVSGPLATREAAELITLFAAKTTTDHSQLKPLQGPFHTGPEVTQACLKCHNQAGLQVMQSIHWTFEKISPTTGKKLGKRYAANNFCGSILSNEPRCTSCHAGYGWTDKNFDFTKQENVDCLACHDTTGTYKKIATDAGHPLYKPREMPPGSGKIVQPPDLTQIAQRVGRPGRGNCGACHFNGGGGDAVKHGDLDSSLIKPSRDLDVHMAVDGANMVCADCHTFNQHQPSGSRYAVTAKDRHGFDLPKDDRNRATCESCHSATPHQEARINLHARKIACQTCHIPAFARGGIATKMLWDWSTAGKRGPDGKPLFIKDDHGHLIYSAEKGDFQYGENVRPEYQWYNGIVRQITITDKIDDSGILVLNAVEGSAQDPNARIWPFKVMHGKQPYDPVNKTLIVNHVYGKDDTSLWENFDYPKAIKAGMEYAGFPYSGQFGFIETRMNWFITHMVAPKENAVSCRECHSRSPDSRLAAITDLYLPGRDRNIWVDWIGWLLVGGAIAAGLLHGLFRLINRFRRNAA